jgi:NADPH-dependent 2,4-dienoyl-CoA reductase/sulfur reductase-like enzyme
MLSRDTTAIVGNGAAAVHACHALRERGYAGAIHLFSDHPEPPYNPMLTPYYLAGSVDRAACFPFGGPELYAAMQVEAHLGVAVVALDAWAHTVEPADGCRLKYDRCLVATGASPVLPPIPGLEGPGVFTLRTMDDADRLRRALQTGVRRGLVLGASLVGIKVAEALRIRGLEVVLLDVAPHVLPLAAGEACARRIEACLAENGVGLRLGCKAVSVATDRDAGTAGIGGIAGGGLRVELSDGSTVHTDLVVVATGVRPNLDFIEPGQVESEAGLIVDDYLRTSAPDLFAAGDVAQAPNLLTGRPEIVGLWANACQQGRTAGRNMAAVAAHVVLGVPAGAAATRPSGVGGSAAETDSGAPAGVAAAAEAYPGSVPGNVLHFFGMTFAGIGGPSGTNLLGDCTGAGIVRQSIGRDACRLRSGGADRTTALLDARVPQRVWAGFCNRLFEYSVLGGIPEGISPEEET